MTDIQNKFDYLHLSNKFSYVNIADGTQSPVLDNRVVHATSFLTDVSYVSKFPVSLNSISQFTKQNSCKVTFFLPIMFFQDMTTGKRIGSGHEREIMYYLDDKVSPIVLDTNQPDPILLRHCVLDILLYRSFSLSFMLGPPFLL